VAHRLLGAGEALAVAKLGPHRHRDQPADAVLGLDQGPARRLASTEALQVPLQRLGLGVGRVDHPIPDRDPLAPRWRQLERSVGQLRPRVRCPDGALGDRNTVLIELGVDPLAPDSALVD
jgi:hypothetical protein